MKDQFATKESLESFLDSPESESWKDEYFETMYDIKLEGLTEVPYWIETYHNKGYVVQYIKGYHEPYKYNEVITIDGISYKYIDSQRLDEETEHQAEDGSLVYEYRGSSFLRILQPIE